MRAQPSHFGFEAPQADGLFFALFPDGKAVAHMTRTAQQLCIRHRLEGRLLAPERFHVSLLGFGERAGLPHDLIAGASKAAAAITMAPFEVTFDRAMSFGKVGGPRPVVLSGSHGVADLIAFRQRLGDAIQRGGVGRVKAQYAPHATLLYDGRGVAEHAIEPVRWTVREFVLVHSLLGQSRYVPLGRWRLAG